MAFISILPFLFTVASGSQPDRQRVSMMAASAQGDWSVRMRLGSLSPAYRLAFVGLLATAFVVSSGWDRAQARAPRLHAKQTDKKQVKRRPIHGPNYNPPYAAIVVDANSDQVLHEANPDAPRHPASLTKIMTLYMLFEQLEAGKLKLDTPLQVSSHAAMQTPTKLGLKANGTIGVEDAIKGMCTRSANDASVVVGEAVGGTEADFARLMTEKARALGMVNTTYVNASGLPAEEQITTARDQAILGRAIQHRFPGYYRYFATPSFRYKGAEMHNHNALLGQVEGADGIKTGYTEASGYNLVSSVRRNEKHIVAVILGGTSNAARDARMRQLIEDHICLASTRRTAPIIVEGNGQRIADGGWTLYFAAQELNDERWRYQSPSRIARLYGRLGWKSTDAELHLVASEADKSAFGVLRTFTGM